ncbi:ACT domain-containing protein [Specibacter sp. NPDC057265]|uniref:ACT domain-containing protein n=1 Tax=Specibacter sp. NPDC057265 TaxID=3346075 RepID=UPI00363E79A5
MAGEKNLQALLHNMSPVLNDGSYVFSIVESDIPSGVRPVVTVREKEGLTLIVEKSDADAAGLSYEYVAAWITLEVHSALEAVGLTAAISNALKEAGISCNVVAGYTHDHLFVPADRAHDALAALRSFG